MKIILIMSIITGLITAVIDYFNTEETQTKIEQVKDLKK